MKKKYQKPAIKTLAWNNDSVMGPSASIVPPEVGAKENPWGEDDLSTPAEGSAPSVWDE